MKLIKNWIIPHQLIILSLCFMLGIWLADSVPFSFYLSLILILLLLLWLALQRSLLVALVLFFVLGQALASFRFLPVDDSAPFVQEQGSYTLRIEVPVQFVGEGLRARVTWWRDGQGIPAQLRVLNGVPELRSGDVVQVWARRRTVRAWQNFGQSDFVRQAEREGWREVFQVRQADATVLHGRSPGLWWSRPLEAARFRLRHLLQTDDPSQGRALLRALLLGDRSGLTDDTRELFRRTGLAHLLAISGQHIGLVALGSFLLFRFGLGFFPRLALLVPLHLLAWGLSLIPALCYLGLAGVPLTAQRAFIFLGLFVMAAWARRQVLGSATLGAALFLLLCKDPAALFTVSFQLSFLAVAVLLWVWPILKIQGSLSWRLILLSSCSIVLVTAPLLAYRFQQIACFAPLANLIAIPVFAWVLLPLSFGSAVLLLWFPQLGHGLMPIFTFCFDALLRLLEAFNHVSLTWQVSLQPWQVVTIYAGLALVFLLRSTMPTRSFRVGLALCFLLLPLFSVWPRQATHFELIVLDVGQGDALLLKFPDGRKYLVDGGGFYIPRALRTFPVPDIGERVLVPALRYEGVRSLSGIILTHPHPDHYGGLEAVLAAMPVDAFYWNGDWAGGSAYADLLTQLQAKQIPLIQIDSESPALTGDQYQLLWWLPQARDLNDRSVVLRVTYGETCFLLTGDIERAAEAQLAEQDWGPCQVLKVPHHGSRTSSSSIFLETVNPEIAVISAGLHNPFGHPHPEVLQRYSDRGILVWRTDYHGAIRILSDGKKIEVQTASRRGPGFPRRWLSSAGFASPK